MGICCVTHACLRKLNYHFYRFEEMIRAYTCTERGIKNLKQSWDLYLDGSLMVVSIIVGIFPAPL